MIELSIKHGLDHPEGAFDLHLEQLVERGNFLSVFGPSGSGKTTLLRCLAGLVRPDSGRIVIDGVVWFDSAISVNLPAQRREIGMVFQSYALFPNLSVRENVDYATQGADRRWIDELLEMTQLTAIQSRLPVALSGGQQQRVALARSVARKPSLLLLDEPLSALDHALRHQLQDDIALLHSRLGFTTILVSHDIGEVFRLSDAVWILDRGKVTRTGTPASVFLPKRIGGSLTLRAQVLAMKKEEVVTVVSLLVGQEIIDMVVLDAEVANFRVGEIVAVSAKIFGATRLDR